MFLVESRHLGQKSKVEGFMQLSKNKNENKKKLVGKITGGTYRLSNERTKIELVRILVLDNCKVAYMRNRCMVESNKLNVVIPTSVQSDYSL